jgi:hypothetical protein
VRWPERTLTGVPAAAPMAAGACERGRQWGTGKGFADAVATMLEASSQCLFGDVLLMSRTFSALGTGAARLAAIPAGVSPANRGAQITVVHMCSDGKGDRSLESLDVRAPVGWDVGMS